MSFQLPGCSSNTRPSMKHRSVVASFFFPPTNFASAPTHVALFRRSHHPKVRSYQGKLAPISGSIDPSTDSSPLAAATREIQEETQLVAHRDLRLAFVGPSFYFVDTDAGRSWTVYPFGWTLLCDEAKVVLDWEHEGWEWVDVGDVLGTDRMRGKRQEECVPRVEDSLRRVYCGRKGMFGADDEMLPGSKSGNAFHSGMKALRCDLENGARVLALEAVKCLREIVDGYKLRSSEDKDSLWQSLRVAGYHLVYSARSSMNAAISSVVVGALAQIHHLLAEGNLNKDKLLLTFEEIISARESTTQEICQWFTEHILSSMSADSDEVTIITLSFSSTIKAVLLGFITNRLSSERNIARINLSILESRPRCEGASFAASMIRALNDLPPDHTAPRPRVAITIAPDSHLPRILTHLNDPASTEQKQYLVIGADRISSRGSVLNKTLSLSAAVIAKALDSQMRKTEVVAVSETDKIGVCKPPDEGVQRETRKHATEEQEEKEHDAEHGAMQDVITVWEIAGVKSEDMELLSDRIGQDEAAGIDLKTGGVKVTIENVVFEWVPSKYIDTYLTEDGPMGTQEIQRRSQEKMELERKMLNGLYDS